MDGINNKGLLKTLFVGILAGVACWATAQADEGLVLHWDFDEVRGRTVRDLSGKGNDGRIEGQVAWIAGVSGKAMLFDGDFSSVWCADNAALNPSNITVMFWLCPKSWGLANTLIDKGWAKGWGIDPQYRGNGIYFCANIGGRRQDTAARHEVSVGRWTHLAVTHDGRRTLLYVNGEKKGEAARDGGLDSRHGKLRIGGMTDAVCYVDDVRIYDRAWGGERIKAWVDAARPAGEGAMDETALEREPGPESLTVNQIPFVRAREANGVIVVDAKAPEVTAAAARELSRYLKKIFAVKMPVVRADERMTPAAQELKDRNLILVGESRIAKALGFTAASLKPDGFRIASQGSVLAVVGRDSEAATLEDMASGSAGSWYGVCRLLEKIGVRWYFPGVDGEVLPTGRHVVVDNPDVTDAPYFVFRYGFPPPGATIRWMRRIGFGAAVYPGRTCHSFHGWHAKYAVDHPEWFALRADGGRGRNLCLSHPEVRQRIIAQAREWFVKHPDVNLFPDFTLLDNDGAPPPCVCPECARRMTPAEGWAGGTSDYWAEVAVKTAEALRDEFPDRKIVIGAYNQQMRPPVGIKRLPDNVSVQIQKLRLHLWSEESRHNNYEEILRGWLDLRPAAVAFWEYYGFDCWGGGKWFGVPGLATEMIASDIRTLKRMSEESGIPFLGEMIFTNGRPGRDTPDRLYWLAPDLYVTAKMLWNPDLPVKPLMEEFYRLHFGPAAAPMKAFYEQLEAVWTSGRWGRNLSGARMGMDEMKRAGGYFGNNPWKVLFTPEILRELAARMADAGKRADLPPYRGRVEDVARQFGTTLKRAERAGGGISAEELEKAMTVW